MSNFTVRRGVREQVPLFVGLSSGTGAGKTLSAMKLATGIAGREKPFAVIDTESGRALHYAPAPGQKPDFKTTFLFDVIELDAPYSSKRYMEAIIDCKSYPCIVVDQASFEHVGAGGHLEQQQQEVQDRVKRAKQRGDSRPEWVLEEAMNRASWIKPKHDRKRLIEALIGVRVPVIFCFRAEEKMQILETVDEKGKKKTTIIAAKDRPLIERWQPICGKEFEPEMLAFFLLTRDNPKGRGVPTILKLNEQHAGFVDVEKPLDEEAGKLFAAWASGAQPNAAAQKSDSSASDGSGQPPPLITSAAAATLHADQCIYLTDLLVGVMNGKDRLLKAIGKKMGAEYRSLESVPASEYSGMIAWIEKAKQT